MAGSSTTEMAIAVAVAGGLGSLPSAAPGGRCRRSACHCGRRNRGWPRLGRGVWVEDRNLRRGSASLGPGKALGFDRLELAGEELSASEPKRPIFVGIRYETDEDVTWCNSA